MLVHKIRQLKQVACLDNIVVSSDSEQMLQMAREEGVSVHKRSIEFCDEKTKTFNEVVELVASECCKQDVLMWSPCTNPLTTPQNYTDALAAFDELVLAQGEYDSVISCTVLKEYLWTENGPLNYNPVRHVPSQNLPALKKIVNGFFIADRKNMVAWKYFYGPKPYLFELRKKEAVDIDDAEDFEIAKALLNVNA